MIIEGHSTAGDIVYINSDLISSICEESKKSRIRMNNGDTFYIEESVESLVVVMSKGSVVRTNWQPSPSS